MTDHLSDMPLAEIGEIKIAPITDIPLSLTGYTIHDRAVEDGYHIGIQKYLQFIKKTFIDPGPLQPLLTIPQVAKILGVSRPTVYQMIYNEGLPIIRFGKAVRILPWSLFLWLVQREERMQESCNVYGS